MEQDRKKNSKKERLASQQWAEQALPGRTEGMLMTEEKKGGRPANQEILDFLMHATDAPEHSYSLPGLCAGVWARPDSRSGIGIRKGSERDQGAMRERERCALNSWFRPLEGGSRTIGFGEMHASDLVMDQSKG